MITKARYAVLVNVLCTAVSLAALVHQAIMLRADLTLIAGVAIVLIWGGWGILSVLYDPIPPLLQTLLSVFIVMSLVLGSVYLFYVRIPVWDTILHALKGVWATLVGLSIPRLFRVSHRSALFAAIVAVCFTVTLGVLWEFGEFALDTVLHTDTQKDWVVTSLYSAKLDPTMCNIPVHIAVDTVAVNGKQLPVNGYLDIGLIDTMKDLLASFVTALITAILWARNVGGSSLVDIDE